MTSPLCRAHHSMAGRLCWLLDKKLIKIITKDCYYKL